MFERALELETQRNREEMESAVTKLGNISKLYICKTIYNNNK